MSVIQLLLKLRCVVGRTFARLSVRDFEIHWISRGFRVSEWISKWICGFKGGFLDFQTENRNGNTTVNQMLVFVPRHPSPLLASSFCHCHPQL